MSIASRRLQRGAEQGASLPPSSSTWAQAVATAQAGTGRANILFVGESYFEGIGMNSYGREYRWIDRLTTQLRSQYSITHGGQAFTATRWSSGLGNFVSSTGTGTAANSESYQAARAYTLASGEYREWAVTGDSIDILYATSTSASSVIISVDGSQVDTFSANAAVSYSNVKHYSLGLSSSHTFRVTSSGGTVGVDGVVIYDGDYSAGISYWDCSKGGFTSGQFQPATGASQGWANGDVHLVIESLYGNDYLTSAYVPSTTASRLQARIQRYKQLPNSPDIVTLLYWDISGYMGTNSLGYTHDDYRNALQNIVAIEGVQVVNLHTIYGTAPASYIGSDGVHPTVEGHQAIADSVQVVLSTI